MINLMANVIFSQVIPNISNKTFITHKVFIYFVHSNPKIWYSVKFKILNKR